jgi:acyl-CoA thioester hydrolase
MVEARVRVIYGDTDKMGVVYYANYFRYFELARSEFFRALGGSYAELEKSGFGLPVVDARCRYKAPAAYDDVLLVETVLSELRRVSLTFDYRIRREGDARVLTEGQTVHACVGSDGKPAPFPEPTEKLLRPAVAQLSKR